METVDQVLSYAREHNGETTPPWACFMEDGGVDISALLDRLEAAIKREREAVGNAAKMREALEVVVKVGYPHNFQREAPHIRGYCYEITTAIEKCFAALSAPARNCDRFKTKEEAALAYAKECNAFIPQSILWQMGEWLDWLFAEAKGGANG